MDAASRSPGSPVCSLWAVTVDPRCVVCWLHRSPSTWPGTVPAQWSSSGLGRPARRPVGTWRRRVVVGGDLTPSAHAIGFAFQAAWQRGITSLSAPCTPGHRIRPRTSTRSPGTPGDDRGPRTQDHREQLDQWRDAYAAVPGVTELAQATPLGLWSPNRTVPRSSSSDHGAEPHARGGARLGRPERLAPRPTDDRDRSSRPRNGGRATHHHGDSERISPDKAARVCTGSVLKSRSTTERRTISKPSTPGQTWR
jgi:hypothetical protein